MWAMHSTVCEKDYKRCSASVCLSFCGPFKIMTPEIHLSFLIYHAFRVQKWSVALQLFLILIYTLINNKAVFQTIDNSFLKLYVAFYEWFGFIYTGMFCMWILSKGYRVTLFKGWCATQKHAQTISTVRLAASVLIVVYIHRENLH